MRLTKLTAIFLDRDGVINRERRDYVKSWGEFQFLPNALGALRQLAALSVPVLVITNQSAIGRGIVSQSEIDVIHRRMQQEVSAAGGRIDQVFVCPHRPDENCACRKPRPGLLLQALARYNLVAARTVFIGDSFTDLQAAQAAGCRSMLVRSGLQGPGLASLLANQPAVELAIDLAAAVTSILTDSNIKTTQPPPAPVEEGAAFDRLRPRMAE
ncbi:MAG: HAD family hydrolase [Caldilineaceae bacterium]